MAAFFGAARASDFRVEDGAVVYVGPPEWSYRRFILHYAHLCALSGGVDAFCIGSEMRSLTQVRDAVDGYPAVRALCALAEEVRGVLGSGVKLGYAADWSEYFGHHPSDGSGDVMFHLDPLWAHPELDFIGIDNYMPLSDWRDGSGHADSAAGSIYDLDYLMGNVAGGEGFDWYYASDDAREGQQRLSISDGAYGEDWTFRYKDIAGWWSNTHVNRLGGVKAASPTPWRPRSKPVWFTELGCPAVDKGTNQPNVFHDPKSSESFFPYFSNRAKDEFIQRRYLQATYAYWSQSDNNPTSDVYSGRMVDMDRAHLWAWDARPWPDFPERLETWVDGLNYDLGHWINARMALPALAEIVSEVCARSGVPETDVSELYGVATGFMIGAVETARQSLQPLMLAFGFDSFTVEDRVVFAGRNGKVAAELSPDWMVVEPNQPVLTSSRSSPVDAPGRVALEFLRSDLDYQPGVAEAVAPQVSEPDAAQSSVPVVMSEAFGKAVAERWLIEARVARDTVQFELPPALLWIASGDVVSIPKGERRDLFRIDRVEELGPRAVTAVRVEPSVYDAPVYEVAPRRAKPLLGPTPVYADFLELPLLGGDEVPDAPYIAVAKTPWAGSVAVYSSASDSGYVLNREILRPAIIGETLEPLRAGIAGLWTRDRLRVRLSAGVLQSQEAISVLNGANAVALRFGESGSWEVVQFTTAQLVGSGEYVLGGLLRGQAGTDGSMPDLWPSGTEFVLLDAGVVQLDQTSAVRGLERHFRIGPSVRGYDHPSYLHAVETFSGVALRPYRPAHLAASRRPDGAVILRWIRRTRIDGDSWDAVEVPLAEERELYRVVIRKDGDVVRDFEATGPSQVYSAADQASDGTATPFTAEVAQISQRYGAGPYAWALVED